MNEQLARLEKFLESDIYLLFNKRRGEMMQSAAANALKPASGIEDVLACEHAKGVVEGLSFNIFEELRGEMKQNQKEPNGD